MVSRIHSIFFDGQEQKPSSIFQTHICNGYRYKRLWVVQQAHGLAHDSCCSRVNGGPYPIKPCNSKLDFQHSEKDQN